MQIPQLHSTGVICGEVNYSSNKQEGGKTIFLYLINYFKNYITKNEIPYDTIV